MYVFQDILSQALLSIQVPITVNWTISQDLFYHRYIWTYIYEFRKLIKCLCPFKSYLRTYKHINVCILCYLFIRLVTQPIKSFLFLLLIGCMKPYNTYLFLHMTLAELLATLATQQIKSLLRKSKAR